MSEHSKVQETQISYWKEALAGAPTKLELPTDKPRPAVQRFRSAVEVFELPKTLLEQLKSLGSQEHATLFMTLGAGFMTLLHRYTGQDDILVGTPIEIESMFGCVLNTVVLRSRFADRLNFRSLLQQIREQVLGAYAHSDLPFEQVIAELVPERDPSHAPLFQVMFILSDTVGRLNWSVNGSHDSGTSKFDLKVFVSETENDLKGLVVYSTDLFEAPTIQRMCGHYRTLLEAIVQDPDQSISMLPMLTEHERTQILYEWNDTHTQYPEACVHELFEQQVTLHPDAIALVFRGQQMSYREVNQRANQVAHYLRKRGIGPERLVGVCMERCPDLLIALLGIWKAGGAYVPLDPAYPSERLSFMVQDASVTVLLTNSEQMHLFPNADTKTICVDSDWPEIAQEHTSNPYSAVSSSNLAYVMYTSGSTGEPKGVMVLHGGLSNYLCWAVQAYSFEASDSVPVHTSISFDLTVTSMYPALLAGGRIEILPEDVGGQNLAAALRNGKDRGLVKITPAHLALLSQQLTPEEAAGRAKVFVIGGENLLAESLLMWRKFAPETRLINEYGPTETVVGCCVYEVRPDDPSSGSVPIGRPIANTQLYVLDRNMNPVPAGVVGELYIGGAGVARGYLNRPELTRQSFIADPFSSQKGTRLYKSGDLARYHQDGRLEYLARVDDQVKVRGYRIELGEIEATLADHPAVKSCAVLAREVEPGNKRLVGYVSSQKGESPTSEVLRSFLRDKLPEYMVPSQIVFLESIPLTSNGKIDRKALPAPSVDRRTLAKIGPANDDFWSTTIRPWTTLEKVLVQIWEELLDVRHIGIRDDFFDLGGDSLLAVRLLAQIEEVLDKRLPSGALLGAATIEQLAALLDQAEARDRVAYAVPVQPKGEKSIFFCVGAGLLLRPLSLQLGPDQPFYSIGLKPECADQLKEPSEMEELAQHLVSALRERQPEGPYYLGGFCEDGVFAYEVASQLTAQGQNIGLLVLFETENPCQGAKSRIATRVRRTVIRLRFRVNQLLRLKISDIPIYARSRLKELKESLTLVSWRVSRYFPRAKRQLGPADLERILFLAASAYKPKPLGCPTVIFRCKDWPIASAGDPYFGWRELLTGRCETYEVPGDHVGIFSESNVKALADQLRARLHNAKQPETHSDEVIADCGGTPY